MQAKTLQAPQKDRTQCMAMWYSTEIRGLTIKVLIIWIILLFFKNCCSPTWEPDYLGFSFKHTILGRITNRLLFKCDKAEIFSKNKNKKNNNTCKVIHHSMTLGSLGCFYNKLLELLTLFFRSTMSHSFALWNIYSQNAQLISGWEAVSVRKVCFHSELSHSQR